jgi:hypothetical protein
VQHPLGHARTSMTARYAHSLDQARKAAVKRQIPLITFSLTFAPFHSFLMLTGPQSDPTVMRTGNGSVILPKRSFRLSSTWTRSACTQRFVGTALPAGGERRTKPVSITAKPHAHANRLAALWLCAKRKLKSQLPANKEKSEAPE